jgi:formate-dependent nitrite reductase membrane component NrfD
MADKTTNFMAEWADNLKVTGNPNRVFESHALAPNASSPIAARPPAYPTSEPHQNAEAGYYDIPMLKAPLWKWEIASYFYLGGLSAGADLIARAAGRFGGKAYADVARVGTQLSFAALLPCPPLLIHDLGDPKRFHHMLRVWKPGTPMNVGTWTLLSYSGIVTYEIVRRNLAEQRTHLDRAAQTNLSKLMNKGTLLMLHDVAGVPLAMLLASYTGVLLSCTANPLWCKNPWLSPLFTASAVSTGAEAISLAIDLTSSSHTESPAQTALKRIDSAAHAVEAVAMQGFMKHAGEKAKTLRTGKQSKLKRLATLGIVAAEVLKVLPVRERHKKPVRMLAAALGLASGFALRWSMIYGGHEAANDPRTARLLSSGGGGRAENAESSRRAISSKSVRREESQSSRDDGRDTALLNA